MLRDELAREQLGAVRAEVEAVLDADEQCAVGGRRAIPGAGARARDLDVVQPALDRDLARDRLGERAPAGVAGTHEENLHRQTSPIRSGTLSRNVAALIAPGRMTRGREAVQSTTVEGGESPSRPPSSTMSCPRAVS